MPVQLHIDGLDKVAAAMDKFPSQIKAAVELAQKDMAKNILDTRGVRNYPPQWQANQPPGTSGRGYYSRGKGWMQATKGGYKFNPSRASERLGTKWYTNMNGFQTTVGNPVSYAPYIHGEEQVGWAKDVGWRKLAEVASDKLDESIAIYERHIQAIIQRLGL